MDLSTYKKKYKHNNPENRLIGLPQGGYLSIDLDNYLRWHSFDCKTEITIGLIIDSPNERKVLLGGGNG